MKKIIVLLAISLIMVMNVLAQEPTPTPHDLIPGLFLYQDDFVPGLLTKMWEYYYLLPFPTNTPVPTNTPTPTNTPDYDLTYLKLDTSNDPLINPLRILGKSQKTSDGLPMFGADTRLFVDGLGYIEFGTKNPALHDYQGLAFSRERVGGAKDDIGFIGMDHGDGLWVVSGTENVKIMTGQGAGAGLYLTEESAMLAKDKAHFSVVDNLIGHSYNPSGHDGVGSTGLTTNFFIGDTAIYYIYEYTPSTPVGAGTPTPMPNAKVYAYSVGDYGHKITNLKSGSGYGKAVAYDSSTGKIGYRDWPTAMPNTPVPTNTPTPTTTPTPIFTGTPMHGDILMYNDYSQRFKVGDYQNKAYWNANRLYYNEIKKASPTPGDVLGFIVDSGTPKWAPVTPIPTLAPPTPQPIPDTPTPYHVPVEMTPEPPISHANLEAILGDPDEIPDGSHYFITDGDTYLYSVAVADARFFVSGYTPVALPDYVVSGAGTTAVNGYYFEDGIEDGVAYYSKSDGRHHLFRATHREQKYWAIHDSIPSPPVDPRQVMYTTLSAADVPPTGVYTIGTGSFPRATVARQHRGGAR